MTFILFFALLDAFKENGKILEESFKEDGKLFFKEDGKLLKESFKKDAEAFGFGKKEEKPKEDKK